MSIRLGGSLAGRSPHEITIIDLSLTGCLIKCEQLLDHGAILDLRLDIGKEPLKAKVQVTDAYRDGAAPAGEAPYLAGLQFLGLPAQDQATLMRFLDAERRRRNAHAPSH
jgi:hypothetical protein